MRESGVKREKNFLRQISKNKGILICLFSCTILYIFVCSQKIDFHTDEYYTYQLSNSSWGQHFLIPQKLWFSAEFIEKQLVVQEDATFDYRAVMEREKGDMHPFLYAAIIHTICSFFPGKFSMWFGLSVNIFFALLSVYFFYLNIKQLVGNRVVEFVTTVFFGTSYAFISQLMFIRAYMILIFLTTFTVYIHLKYWESSERAVFYIQLGLISLFGALIHYFYIVFLIGCCLVFFMKLMISEKYKQAIIYTLTETTVAVLSILIWPDMLNKTNIFNGGEKENSIDFFSNLKNYMQLINNIYFSGLLWLILIICIMGIVCKVLKNHKLNEYKQKILFMIIPCIISFLMICITANLVAVRYLSGIYPIILLIFFNVFFVELIKVINIRSFYIVLIVFCSLLLFKGYYGQIIDQAERKSILLQSDKRLEKNAVLFIKDNVTWTIPSALSELKDYNSLLVYPYDDIDSQEFAQLMSGIDYDTINIYCYTWNMDTEELESNKVKILDYFNGEINGVSLEKLWNSWYSQVYSVKYIE